MQHDPALGRKELVGKPRAVVERHGRVAREGIVYVAGVVPEHRRMGERVRPLPDTV